MTAGCLDAVRQFSKALGERNLAEARGLLHDDLVVSEAGGLPYSGEYHGPQGFFDLFVGMSDVLELKPGPITHHVLGDVTVLAQFRLKFTSRTSGESTEMSVIELYKVSDGLIVELDVYYKDPAAVAALMARAAANHGL